MKCENCGASAARDAKFCERCGSKIVPTQTSPRYDLAAELELTEDDIECANYHEIFCSLRNKGVIGLLIGIGLGCFAASQMASTSGPVAWVILPLVFGYFFAGFPYGWSLITQLTGGPNIYGSIVIMIFFYILKLAFAAMLGWMIFPFMLLYSYMMSKKKGSKARKVCQIIMIAAVAVSLVFGLIAGISELIGDGVQPNESESQSSGTESFQPVTVDSFASEDILLATLQNDALAFTQAKEKSDIDDYGWTVSEQSQIHYVLFFGPKGPDGEPQHNAAVSNAIIVVAGYYVDEVNAWEMAITVYPNFTYTNGELAYEEDGVYRYAIRVAEISEALEFVYSEYGESRITMLLDSQS